MNDSALLSGYFFDFGEIELYKQTYLQLAKRRRQFLEETESFISAAVEFFGEPDISSSDPMIRGRNGKYSASLRA